VSTQPVRPRLSIFPRDEALRAHAETALDVLVTCLPEELERELRATYPAVSVRPKSDAAQVGHEGPCWYVFREGGVRAAPPPDWWLEPDLPTFVIGDDGAYLDANDAAATLVGLTVERIVGARIGSFTRHEATDAAGMRVFETLALKGTIESTAVVVPANEEERPVDYRVTRRPDGGYAMIMRERR